MAIDYFENEEENQPQGSTLEQLREYADEITLLEEEVAKDTLALSEKTQKLKKLTQKTVPGIMEELQIKSFKLVDGSELTVEDKVQCSIKAEHKALAYAWLEKYHFDGIIKTSVSVSFGNGEMEDAKKAQKVLSDAGISATFDRSIHNATLTSFVKERLAAAADIVTLEQPELAEPVEVDGFSDTEGDQELTIPNLPLDLFGVFEFKQCKIKLPKKSKK